MLFMKGAFIRHQSNAAQGLSPLMTWLQLGTVFETPRGMEVKLTFSSTEHFHLLNEG